VVGATNPLITAGKTALVPHHTKAKAEAADRELEMPSDPAIPLAFSGDVPAIGITWSGAN
jgi:hypothetical protein